MKKVVFLLVMIEVNLFAQSNLARQWDYRYGGDTLEFIGDFKKTFDGGFLIGGTTYSDSSGDISQHSNGNADFWIIKTDNNGIKLWDKRYGGLNNDNLTSIQQTKDSGFILAGYTNSDSSGDVSQNSRGLSDYWMIKVDSLGIKQWDKRYGGNNLDFANSVVQTKDGGYILAGATMSDSSGDVSEPSKGYWDMWILKTDSIGNKLWDKRFGGNQDDRAIKIIETNDSGFLIGGFTTSDSSEDVSQHTRGGFDFWIVKTDSIGHKLWDKRFGGGGGDLLEYIYQTDDNGYFLLGETQSDSSGDVSHHILCTCGDEWVIRIDSIGNKIWDNCYGGTIGEDEGFIIKTNDGNYLLGINSYSPASGEKSENNLGEEQSWLLKIDPLGNKIWDKTILTTGHDEYTFIAQSDDGCFVIANMTNSGIGGYKTEQNWNNCQMCYDFWIVKFCDSTLTGIDQISNPEIYLYPNPTTGTFTLTYNSQLSLKNSQLIITDVLGRAVYSQPINNSTQSTINISQLSNGVYFYQLSNGKETWRGKVVKEN